MILDPPPKLDSEESNIIPGSIGISSINITNEVISKMVSTHILKRWDESNTQLYPSFSAMNPPEHIYLNIFSITLI